LNFTVNYQDAVLRNTLHVNYTKRLNDSKLERQQFSFTDFYKVFFVE